MTVTDEIKAALQRFKAHNDHQAKFTARGLPHNQLLVINNSFLYRDVPTKKAEEFLAFKVKADGTYGSTPYIVTGAKFNLPLKELHSASQYNIVQKNLGAEVRMQVKNLGSLVMCLIGTIDDSVITEYSLKDSGPFSSLRLDPTLQSAIVISPPDIILKSAFDEQSIWTNVENYLHANSVSFNERALRPKIAKGLDKLLESATATLQIPAKRNAVNHGLTDQLVAILTHHLQDYRQALQNQSLGTVSNDVLRIAYNFAGDALKFIRLIICVCDLKPVVFWLTIDKHYKLFCALEALPWISHFKPSLDNYYYMVSGARNMAFHQFFPFQKTLIANLPQVAFEGATAHLFPEYNKRQSPTRFTFRDKQLLDALMEFTRTKERQVDFRFWTLNENVMRATIDLFSATADALRTLNSA